MGREHVPGLSPRVWGYLDTPFRVLEGGVEIAGYTFTQDSNNNLEILTPAGDRAKIFTNGDVGAFQ